MWSLGIDVFVSNNQGQHCHVFMTAYNTHRLLNMWVSLTLDNSRFSILQEYAGTFMCRFLLATGLKESERLKKFHNVNIYTYIHTYIHTLYFR